MAGVPVFEVLEKWIDRVAVVSVSGEVDALTAPQLAEVVQRVVAEGPSAVVIDLAEVTFLASSGMTLLIGAHEQITPGARLAVVADGPSTSRPLHVMGIDAILTLYPTLDEALKALSLPSGAHEQCS